MSKFTTYFFILFFIISLFFSLFSQNTLPFKKTNNLYHFSQNYIFEWPLENNFDITSKFGKRIHPITQKESFHSGIDIPSKENTNIYSISDGVVSYIGFLGANGYSIIISYNAFEIIYGHVSPNYIINKNDKIQTNQLIGFIGPKYLTSKTPYKSNNGYYLNGLTTGTHLHLSIKKDGMAVNPLDYL